MDITEYIGKKINKLTIIKELDYRKSRLWVLCHCECGNYKEIQFRSVKRSVTKSCGCDKNTIAIKRNDLEGKTFGTLTAIKIVGKTSRNCAIWECICKCGKITNISRSNLKRSKSCGCLKNPSGENSPFYKHDKTDEERFSPRSRTIPGYVTWRKSIFERDNYTCQKCKEKSGILNAHHIENYATNKDKRIDMNNAITLCKTCHKEFHKIYGNTSNNKEQLNKYLN